MKACVIQPPYSRDLSQSDALFAYKLEMLDKCDESLDIIVLPEYSDVPCATATKEDTFYYHNKYIGILLDKCIETAKRCHALLFVNALYEVEEGKYRNTTYAYDREGKLVGKYFKKHLPPSELYDLELDSDYTFEPSFPTVLELEGLRFGFLTCYDFYFYEAFPAIARENVDIIIGCSLQRSDSHDAIETMCRFLAYNTNAYVLRASVSFDEASTICGASMMVSPYGRVLANMGGRFGMATAEFDPKDKHYKPAGFGNPPAPHYEYIEFGRKPWQYRPAGTAIINDEKTMGYPRLCSHRGFNAVLPENSMLAFGAAVALGAEEIEFDLWPTKDGEIVSCHDKRLERVSTGTGEIVDYTLAELEQFDFGIKRSEFLEGLKIVRFEDILRKFSCHVIMNIHVKPLSYDKPYPEDLIHKIVNLIKQYNAEKHVYFMLETDIQIQQFKKIAPEIPVCVGHLGSRAWEIVERAIEFNCEKVQFYETFVNEDMIKKAHAHGIRCNMFYADLPDDAERLFSMGIDTLLTNNYMIVSGHVRPKFFSEK